MNKLKFFAALCCAAMVFAACDKNNEPKNDDSKDGGKEQSSYTLTVLSNDETLGTVTGSGKYDAGATVKIVAAPAEGAEFISWSDDAASKELEREIILTSDSTITATFGRAGYTLTVLSNDETLGKVSGSGRYDIGATAKIVATPAEGAEFISWSDDTVSVELEREIILTSDSTIRATFSRAAVDLGLPSGLKWAPCNVGANKPEEYGNYYAWGEIKPKASYLWKNYELGAYDYVYGNDYSKLTKYNPTDGLTTLEAADDAATANWGDAWRMPTDGEWKELLENCTWTYTTQNGVRGCEVKGANGNSIFLPAAGTYNKGEDNRSKGDFGYYWSSSLAAPAIRAWSLQYTDAQTEYYTTDIDRFQGSSVRPVRK